MFYIIPSVVKILNVGLWTNLKMEVWHMTEGLQSEQLPFSSVTIILNWLVVVPEVTAGRVATMESGLALSQPAEKVSIIIDEGVSYTIQ